MVAQTPEILHSSKGAHKKSLGCISKRKKRLKKNINLIFKKIPKPLKRGIKI